MNIVVTGVGGFIGRGILRHLFQAGHQTLGLYRRRRPDYGEIKPQPTLVGLDINDIDNLDVKCDYLIHAASDTPQTASNPAQMWRSNVDGVRVLTEWAKRSNVRNILYCSSMAVYGDIVDNNVDESTRPVNPDIYGQSKYLAEQIFREFVNLQENVNCAIIRLPGVLSKDAQNTFIPRLVKNILRGCDAEIYSTEGLFNNVVLLNDLIDYALGFPKMSQSECVSLFNVASKEPLLLAEVAEHIMLQLDGRRPIVTTGVGRRPHVIDTVRATEFGFRVRTTKEVLRTYVDSLDPQSFISNQQET